MVVEGVFMKDLIEDMSRELKLGRDGIVALLLTLMVSSAVMGWLYEMGFYFLDSGGTWVARGHGLGPWLPIYGFGGLGMLLICWRVRHRPLPTFLSFIMASPCTIWHGNVAYRALHEACGFKTTADDPVSPWGELEEGCVLYRLHLC